MDEGSNPSGSTITHNCLVDENIINPSSLLEWVLLFLDTWIEETGSCNCRTGTNGIIEDTPSLRLRDSKANAPAGPITKNVRRTFYIYA
ncbi:MAG: hypothetical protein HKO54_00265 [Flavobacteriaceae bacterium]|nr:hypothetical protein [Flavobacteriaceae bacterium]